MKPLFTKTIGRSSNYFFAGKNRLFSGLFLIIIYSCICMLNVHAQAPQAISYQAVARDNSGNPIINQNISLRFSIHDLTAAGTVVYKETQSVTTSAIGSFTANVGQGTVVTGTFISINWGSGSKFIQVEMDAAGGTAYVNMGTQQMLSVPYALSSASSTGSWSLTGNTGTVDGTNSIGTNDNVPFNFKVNNQKAGRIDNASFNTFLGYQSGNANTTGNNNAAIGHSALLMNTVGVQNTAIGEGALLSNVAGQYATAIGFRSQYYTYNSASPFNNWNTSIGWESLMGSVTPGNNTGNFNTAMGAQVLGHNTSGTSNTGLGFGALVLNTGGTANTASGQEALNSNLTGSNGTANGYQALYSNTDGIRNTGTGQKALYSNTTGDDNVACGTNTLSLTTVANYNTALGASAGALRDNGGFNTFIGHSAYANADGYTNSTLLGDNTSMTASNQVRIGNLVTSIGGPQNWTNTSDGRIKFDVREDVPGLTFIKMLRPVTYNKSIKKEYEIIGKTDICELPANNTYEKIRYTGFIAQEVEKVAKEIGYDFSGVDAPKNEKDLYGLRYAEFVVPLVKAVQEQQSIIDDQKKMIAEIKLQNEKLNADNVAFKSDLEKIKAQLGMDMSAKK